MVPPMGSGGEVKNPNRVMAGKKAAQENKWLSDVRQFRAAHPGMSQKEAMVALSKSRACGSDMSGLTGGKMDRGALAKLLEEMHVKVE